MHISRKCNHTHNPYKCYNIYFSLYAVMRAQRVYSLLWWSTPKQTPKIQQFMWLILFSAGNVRGRLANNNIANSTSIIHFLSELSICFLNPRWVDLVYFGKLVCDGENEIVLVTYFRNRLHFMWQMFTKWFVFLARRQLAAQSTSISEARAGAEWENGGQDSERTTKTRPNGNL